MLKRLSLLGGLAIFAVVLNHAAQWGFITLFEWNPSQFIEGGLVKEPTGSLTYFTLLTLEKLPIFCVPAFLFISGFFAAYAARKGKVSWKIIRSRLTWLLIPYFIWATLLNLPNFIQGEDLALLRYLWRLFWGSGIGPYFFVPLICQLYILSPWIAPLAKERPKLLLAITGGIQGSILLFSYIHLLSDQALVTFSFSILSRWSLFFMWWFYFALGMVSGYHLKAFKVWVEKLKWLWLSLAVVSAGVMLLEADWVFKTYAVNWRDNPFTLPSSLYALAFILSFLAFNQVKIPGTAIWTYLNAHTYGIYLIHVFIVIKIPWVIRAFLPVLLNFPILIVLITTIFSIGVPLLLMKFIFHSPLRVAYRYLFG